MKLRWHVKKNKINARMLRDYREIHGGGLLEAKKKLMKSHTDLEYFDDEDGEWKVLPTVVTEIIPDITKKRHE